MELSASNEIKYRINTAGNVSIQVQYWNSAFSQWWNFSNQQGTDFYDSNSKAPGEYSQSDYSVSTSVRVLWGNPGEEPSNLMRLETTGATSFQLTGNNLTPRFEILPSISLGIYDSTCHESGDTGTFRFFRSGSTASTLTIYFTRGGSAWYSPSAPDYYFSTAGSAMTASQVTFPVGIAEVFFTIHPYADGLSNEPDETVELTLQTDSSYYRVTADTKSISIKDD